MWIWRCQGCVFWEAQTEGTMLTHRRDTWKQSTRKFHFSVPKASSTPAPWFRQVSQSVLTSPPLVLCFGWTTYIKLCFHHLHSSEVNWILNCSEEFETRHGCTYFVISHGTYVSGTEKMLRKPVRPSLWHVHSGLGAWLKLAFSGIVCWFMGTINSEVATYTVFI